MQKTFCFVVLMLAFAASPCFAGGSFVLSADCYPENKAVLTAANGSDSGTDEIGPTWASGIVWGDFEEIEGDFAGRARDLGGAEVSLVFVTNITGANTVKNPGTSQGALKLDIEWKDPSRTGWVRETHFTSGCVAEIQTAHQSEFLFPSVGEVEAELEGGAKNFPFYLDTTKPAVASVAVLADVDNPGMVEVDVSVELGTTCNENTGPKGTDIELEKIAFKNQSPWAFPINNNGNHTLYSQPKGCKGVGGEPN